MLMLMLLVVFWLAFTTKRDSDQKRVKGFAQGPDGGISVMNQPIVYSRMIYISVKTAALRHQHRFFFNVVLIK